MRRIPQAASDTTVTKTRFGRSPLAIGAEAFIPFKRNHTGKGGGLWGEKYRQVRENPEYFYKHYHQRSNIETTIMM
jgi:hypothetical protein